MWLHCLSSLHHHLFLVVSLPVLAAPPHSRVPDNALMGAVLPRGKPREARLGLETLETAAAGVDEEDVDGDVDGEEQEQEQDEQEHQEEEEAQEAQEPEPEEQVWGRVISRSRKHLWPYNVLCCHQQSPHHQAQPSSCSLHPSQAGSIESIS